MARPVPDDDAALRWDDVDDPSWIDPGADEPADEAAADLGGEPGAAGGAGSASVDAGTDATADVPAGAPLPAPGLRLLTALFAVVYVLWSVGWIIGVGLLPISGPTLLVEVLSQFSEFLAIIASALWFATTLSLTREGRALHRIGWLALGTLVLLPWPFVLGVIA